VITYKIGMQNCFLSYYLLVIKQTMADVKFMCKRINGMMESSELLEK